MTGKLAKRRRWRPRDASGMASTGGAGGFHLPQREGRYSNIAPPPKPKRSRRKKAA